MSHTSTLIAFLVVLVISGVFSMFGKGGGSLYTPVLVMLGMAVGMVPIAVQWAIGLERLSPLAVVAIGGLLVSTFLTMVYVPDLYSLFEDAQRGVRRLFPGRHATTSEVAAPPVKSIAAN